jgi:hypothetical protein
VAGTGVAITALAGVTVPVCFGQQGCGDGFGPAPAVAAAVLYQATRRVGVGLVGQLARVHWSASSQVDSDLTTAFIGVVARMVPFPDSAFTPVFQLALGQAFQSQTGSNQHCTVGWLRRARSAWA